MATKLDKQLKREIDVDGKPYMLAITPEGLKLTEKGKRKGQEALLEKSPRGSGRPGHRSQCRERRGRGYGITDGSGPIR